MTYVTPTVDINERNYKKKGNRTDRNKEKTKLKEKKIGPTKMCDATKLGVGGLSPRDICAKGGERFLKMTCFV